MKTTPILLSSATKETDYLYRLNSFQNGIYSLKFVDARYRINAKGKEVSESVIKLMLCEGTRHVATALGALMTVRHMTTVGVYVGESVRVYSLYLATHFCVCCPFLSQGHRQLQQWHVACSMCGVCHICPWKTPTSGFSMGHWPRLFFPTCRHCYVLHEMCYHLSP